MATTPPPKIEYRKLILGSYRTGTRDNLTWACKNLQKPGLAMMGRFVFSAFSATLPEELSRQKTAQQPR